MSLKDFNIRQKKEFVSIDSVVNDIAKTDDLPLDEAILSLHSFLKSEKDWSYIYRNEATLITEGECLYVHIHVEYDHDL